MTNKVKLLIGLLTLGMVLIGGGAWFISNPLHEKELEIAIMPAPGNFLSNANNESSEVLLKSIQIKKSASDKEFVQLWPQLHTVETGETILVINGSIQNKHQENKEIAMYAEGYDKTGKQVAWTLDAAHIAGQIGLHLENGETGEFTLHLNFSKSVNSIRIYASNYPFTPP
jgi:hypothetical protein